MLIDFHTANLLVTDGECKAAREKILQQGKKEYLLSLIEIPREYCVRAAFYIL